MGAEGNRSWRQEVWYRDDGSREDSRREEDRIFLEKLRSFLSSIAYPQMIDLLLRHFSGEISDAEIARHAGKHRATVARWRDRLLRELRRLFVEGLVPRVLSTIRCEGRCQIHPFTGESLPVPERAVSLSEHHSTFDWFPQPEDLTRDIDRKMEVVFDWKRRHGVQLFLGGWQEKRQCKFHLDLNRPIEDGGEATGLPASLGGPPVFYPSSGQRVRLDSIEAPRRAA